jgi:hypothetical protein
MLGAKAEMDAMYPILADLNHRVDNQNQPFVQISAEIADGKLIITVRETKALVDESGPEYPFEDIMTGSNKGGGNKHHDTDSLQVAVLWTDKAGYWVRHDTNAMSEEEPKPHKIGADWVIPGVSPRN